MKICIVSSCGGHLTEARQLLSVYKEYEHFYILNDNIMLPDDMIGKTYFIRHSERDMLFFINLWEGLKIMQREQPDIILSTGAGPVVPIAIIARLFYHTKIIFIETITRINKPSMTGRVMYKMAHHFFYQWKPLKQFFPKGVYGGTVI